MEAFLIIVSLVWSILCIILFFKIWGMCNNVSEIKDILKKTHSDIVSKNERDLNGICPASDNKKENYKLKANVASEGQNDPYSSSESDKYKNFAIYKPENMKVEILGKDDGNVYKCRSVKDGQIYYFIEDVLEFGV